MESGSVCVLLQSSTYLDGCIPGLSNGKQNETRQNVSISY
jgi:hypothetical protein